MACCSLSMASSPINSATEEYTTSLRQAFSGKDLCGSSARIMRRSCSDNHLCYSVNRIRATTTGQEQNRKLKNSPSMGTIFKFQLSGSILPGSLRSFLFDPETSKGMNLAETEEHEGKIEGAQKRANWVERILEIHNRWRKRQQNKGYENGDDDNGDDSSVCEVDYGNDEEEEDEDENEGEMKFDRETFSSLLKRVSLSDTKHFSQLAFLSNTAYVIPELKADDLRRYYGLSFRTSSLEKKAATAAAMKAESDRDSVDSSGSSSEDPAMMMSTEPKRRIHPSVAYEIAAEAASYVQSCNKEEEEEERPLLSSSKCHRQELEESPSSPPAVYNSEMCAYMAASTMTAVVSAGEKQKLEAAKDLQSLHSSPCEWFVCDDSRMYTRIFVIQGSDSLASWLASLFFEPTQFEKTGVLVHRGIYEAAKGIYKQFMPEIMEHLNRYGDRAKFQFTGHSLGGSLSLVVSLMLLTRKVVEPSTLLPVVTFGSPFVFCGGQKILNQLGLDEKNHLHCVMMHRDIVPRAFSCNYPNHVAQVLKSLNGTFRSHPCLNKNKLLYTPMGRTFILQPDEKSSAPHPLLPPGRGLYEFAEPQCTSNKNALRVFLNSPHPLETLSDPTAYGSEGTIIVDHESSNYLKAMNGTIRQKTQMVTRKIGKHGNILWPLLTSHSPRAWGHDPSIEDSRLIRKEMMTGV